MHTQTVKVLFGITLSLPLLMLASPAMADPLEQKSEQFLSQAAGTTRAAVPVAVRGVIQSIEGDQVTLKQPWGETVVVEVSRAAQDFYGLEPGTDVAIRLKRGVDRLVAQKICTRLSPTRFVAVEPIRVPQVGQSEARPPAITPRRAEPAAPQPAAPVPALW